MSSSRWLRVAFGVCAVTVLFPALGRAGLCDVTYGMRINGGLTGGVSNQRVIAITTPNSNTVRIHYVKNENYTQMFHSDLLLTKMSVTGNIDPTTVAGTNRSIVQAHFDQDPNDKDWRFVGNNGVSGSLVFSADNTNDFKFAINTSALFGVQITGMWSSFDFTAGVPRVILETYSAFRNPTFERYHLRLYCPGTIHEGFTLSKAELIQTGTMSSGRAIYAPKVSLKWKPMVRELVANIQSYRIYRSTSKGDVGTLIGSSTTTENGLIDETVSMGKAYYYRIRPVLTDGSESIPRNETEKVERIYVPLDPFVLKATIVNIMNSQND